MSNGYTQKIRERIENSVDGTIFTTADFVDIAEKNTIRQNMLRLVNEGVIRRIINGVYVKPHFSNLLGEYIAPDPNAVAEAIAKSYHWTIAPNGNTALNLLGLSTQVPATWSYISDGPYRKYEWSNTVIEFKHRTNKEVTGLSYMTVLLIQALKTLGKDNITQDTINFLSQRLSKEEKDSAIREALRSTDWVYTEIKKICEVDR